MHDLITGSNYTIVLVVLCQIISITIILKNWRSEKAHKLMLLYTTYGLFIFTLGHYLFFSLKQYYVTAIAINESLNVVFAVIEISAFTHILMASINSKSLRIINRGIIIFVTAITPVLLITIFNEKVDKTIKRYITDSFSFFEITYIGILILIYFISIFKSSPEIDLKKRPTFWICSFSILYTISLPLTILLLEHFRHANRDIFQIIVSLHYLSLSFVYIGISKATLCKRPLTN